MSNKTITAKSFMAGVISAAIVITASGAAFADSDESLGASIRNMLAAPLEFDAAAGIARQNAKGKLVEISLDEFEGQPVYLATLAGETSLSEMIISATDGSILVRSEQTAATPQIMESLIEDEIEEMLLLSESVSDLEADEELVALLSERVHSCPDATRTE